MMTLLCGIHVSMKIKFLTRSEKYLKLVPNKLSFDILPFLIRLKLLSASSFLKQKDSDEIVYT